MYHAHYEKFMFQKISMGNRAIHLHVDFDVLNSTTVIWQRSVTRKTAIPVDKMFCALRSVFMTLLG